MKLLEFRHKFLSFILMLLIFVTFKSPVFAEPTYQMKLTSCTATVAGASAITAHPGEVVTLKADQIPGASFIFFKVTKGSFNLTAYDSETTTFVMPPEDIAIEARYYNLTTTQTEYPVIITNGVARVNNVIVTKAHLGDTVIIRANDVAGQTFANWRVDVGNIILNSYSLYETSFTMTNSPVEITALYTANEDDYVFPSVSAESVGSVGSGLNDEDLSGMSISASPISTVPTARRSVENPKVLALYIWDQTNHQYDERNAFIYNENSGNLKYQGITLRKIVAASFVHMDDDSYPILAIRRNSKNTYRLYLIDEDGEPQTIAKNQSHISLALNEKTHVAEGFRLVAGGPVIKCKYNMEVMNGVTPATPSATTSTATTTQHEPTSTSEVTSDEAAAAATAAADAAAASEVSSEATASAEASSQSATTSSNAATTSSPTNLQSDNP